MTKYMTTILCLLFVAGTVQAQRSRVNTGGWQPSTGPVYTGPSAATPAKESLAEVNRERARRGLRPFIFDAGLTQGALNLASFRANVLCGGHARSDFAGLPAGAHAAAGGCGALAPSWGWGTCATYDNYTYAGAAFAWGRDGKRYMHLFVR